MNTGDKTIAEGVSYETLWSCGLSKEAASNTDPDYWPGKNRLGKLWMKIRK